MDKEIYAALGICYKKTEGGNLFLLLKHQKGYYTFPGGGKEFSDLTLEETLIRELKEELGITISPDQLLDTGLVNVFTYDAIKPERAGKVGKTKYYLLQFTGREKFSSFDKISGFSWYTGDQVIKMLPYKNEAIIFSKIAQMLE